MAQTLRDAIRAWLGGIVLAGVSNRQIPQTSPNGINSMLTNVVRGQSCSIGKRPGLKTVNLGNDVLTNGADQAVLAQFDYTLTDGNRYHIYYLANGHYGWIASDPGGTGAFTDLGDTGTGLTIPDFALANDQLFGLNSDGAFKLRGTNSEGWGIESPVGAGTPTLADGGAGVMTGTYEVRVTFYNANNDHESSAGDTSSSLALSGRQLSISNIPTSADTQVTSRKVYIRDITTQTEFRLLTTIANNFATTYTANVDVSTLIILGPNTTENDPPPAGARHCAWVNSRMFVAVDSLLYWSKKGDPESFDSTFEGEPINKEDGQNIVALVGFGEDLLIFKEQSVHVLTGTTPESWRIFPLFTNIGAVSRWSIVEVGGVLYWWSHRGPMRWQGSGQPEPIGELLLGNASTSPMSWRRFRQGNIQGAVDTINKLVLWTFPDWNSSLNNNAILPFSYESDAFVASYWNPLDIASLYAVKDTNGDSYVYAGNYNGQIFRFSTSYTNDGVPGGTMSGTLTVASSGTQTSVSGTGFYTTGEGLKGRYVTFEYASGSFAGHYMGRSKITSNTSTTLTIDGISMNAGDYNFYIGGPNFEWDTVDHDSGVPFRQKRYEWLNVAVGPTGADIGVFVFVDQHFSKVGEGIFDKSYSFNADSSSSKAILKNFRVGKVGTTWRARFYNRVPGTTVRLDEVAMESELLTGKLG